MAQKIDALEVATSITLAGQNITSQAVNPQTGTTYTLAVADNQKIVTLSNANAITVTIPKNASIAMPVGCRVDCVQIAAGKVTFAAEDGDVTINSKASNKSLAAQWAACSLIQTAANVWLIVGDLIA